MEDYKDFLRQGKYPIWAKDDPRILKIRSSRTCLSNPETFGKLMVTLCTVEGFLLDRLLRAREEKFVKEGVFREKLFKKRREFIKNR